MSFPASQTGLHGSAGQGEGAFPHLCPGHRCSISNSLDFQAQRLKEAILGLSWLIIAVMGLFSVLELCLPMCLQLPRKELAYEQTYVRKGREGGSAESQSHTGSWGLSGWSLR